MVWDLHTVWHIEAGRTAHMNFTMETGIMPLMRQEVMTLQDLNVLTSKHQYVNKIN
jgi:hypothetical protein